MWRYLVYQRSRMHRNKRIELSFTVYRGVPGD